MNGIVFDHNAKVFEHFGQTRPAISRGFIRRGKIIAQGAADELKQHYLGNPEFEAVLCEPWSRNGLVLPGDSEITSVGETWLRFRSPAGEAANPQVLRHLLDEGLPVAQLNEVSRSLENVYLMAMSQAKAQEAA